VRPFRQSLTTIIKGRKAQHEKHEGHEDSNHYKKQSLILRALRGEINALARGRARTSFMPSWKNRTTHPGHATRFYQGKIDLAFLPGYIPSRTNLSGNKTGMSDDDGTT
jgi:hypothetical protein